MCCSIPGVGRVKSIQEILADCCSDAGNWLLKKCSDERSSFLTCDQRDAGLRYGQRTIMWTPAKPQTGCNLLTKKKVVQKFVLRRLFCRSLQQQQQKMFPTAVQYMDYFLNTFDLCQTDNCSSFPSFFPKAPASAVQRKSKFTSFYRHNQNFYVLMPVIIRDRYLTENL